MQPEEDQVKDDEGGVIKGDPSLQILDEGEHAREEAEDAGKPVSLHSLVGEAMRQRVDKEVRKISNDQMTIYDTVQLVKEIETYKKKELTLVA